MPSSYTNVTLQKPNYLATGNWTPQDDRKWFSDMVSPGVVGAGDFLVSFVSGLTVQVAAGTAYIKGQNVADQGTYRQYEATSHNINVGAGGANPRLDQIILRVLDQDHDTSGSYLGVIEVIPGTPTAGATLANRSGAADLTTLSNGSKNVLLLADVLVGAGAGSISAGAIGDKRVRATMFGNIIVPRVRANRTANQSIANNTDVAIIWQATRVNNSGMWVSTANTRFTVQEAGFYGLSLHTEWAANASGNRQAWFLLNGVTEIARYNLWVEAISGTNNDRIHLHTEYEFAAGDYVECMVRQTSGASLNLIQASNSAPEGMMYQIG